MRQQSDRARWLRRLCLAACVLGCAGSTQAQQAAPRRVEIPFDRYNDTEQLHEWMRRIGTAYPDLVNIRSIGKSIQGREMLLAVVNSSKTGPDTSKPAMWIDGNIHGNEVQAGEVVLYTLLMLASEYGHNPEITRLVDAYSFYLLPSVNPDGRQYWFDHANTPHSSRQNQRPMDSDRDGLMDEDGADDLDKDGQITQMWKADPAGRWVRSQTDDRVFVRLEDDQAAALSVATYTSLGEEGIDNDGDGRMNEDGVSADDMNRNFPGDWQPNHVQGGAGPYALSSPETAAVASFILDHPNIAAVQSYHNTGGMILRGPGAKYREGMYPGEDVRVYDQLARTGEQMLPYYRYLVIFSGLYGVHGGFVNWTGESLGAFSFTNELWTNAKYFQRDGGASNEQEWLWRDRMAFGTLFSTYKEFEHPQYGKVLIGGLNKWSSRVTPPFMLEEECHRNFAFTLYHADQMPLLSVARTEVTAIAARADLWRIKVEIANDKLIPTRSGVQQRERIGWPDMLEMEAAEARTLTASRLKGWFDATPEDLGQFNPARLLLWSGVPGRGRAVYEFTVSGARGQTLTLRYTSSWARTLEQPIVLQESTAKQ